MVEQTPGKRVSWSQLEEYLATHQQTIASFVDLKKRELMDSAQIEAILPKSFMQLHQVITKILKDNTILPDEEESKASQLQLIVKTVMKLQSTLIMQNTKDKEEINCVIRSMSPEITNIFGSAMQQEVSRLLENLGGMTDIIEANFSQIKEILQKNKEEVIYAITQEKNNEISELKNEIRAKEVQINNLKLKEGQL